MTFLANEVSAYSRHCSNCRRSGMDIMLSFSDGDQVRDVLMTQDKAHELFIKLKDKLRTNRINDQRRQLMTKK